MTGAGRQNQLEFPSKVSGSRFSVVGPDGEPQRLKPLPLAALRHD